MRRGLQVLLLILGGVMVVAGFQGVLGGATSVLGGNEHSASVDSEFRFYSVWYAAMGAILLLSLPRVEAASTEVRIVAAGFFLAAVGRLLSIAYEGSPHGYYVALMVIEFVIPVVIVPWQAAAQRRALSGFGRRTS